MAKIYETVREYVQKEIIKQAKENKVDVSAIQLIIYADTENGLPAFKVLKRSESDNKYYFLTETDFYKIAGIKEWADWKKYKEKADFFLMNAFNGFSQQLQLAWHQVYFLISMAENAKPRVYLYSGIDKLESTVSWKDIFIS